MSVISMKQLLEAGVHFGHQTRRWNPKMAEYIFAERNGIYIIDLQKTVKKVDEAYTAVANAIADGGEILFVGTKKDVYKRQVYILYCFRGADLEYNFNFRRIFFRRTLEQRRRFYERKPSFHDDTIPVSYTHRGKAGFDYAPAVS